MKKVLGIIVILAVVLFGSYFAMGLITEHTLKKTVNMVNQSNELFVEFLEYKRGWFKSQATINWRLRVPARITKNDQEQLVTIPAKEYKGSVPLNINHGPIIYANNKILFGLGDADIHLTLPEEYQEYFNKMYSDKSVMPILDLNVFVNYLNNTKFIANVPHFNLISNDNQTQMISSGITSEVNLSPKLNRVIASLNINDLTFIKEHQKVVIGKISSDCNLKYTKNGLYIGNAHVMFPSILVTNKDQTILKLSQFEISSESHVLKSLFNSNLKLDLDQLFTHGSNYGPAHVMFSLKNLDAKTLAEINHIVSSMQPSTDTERQQLLLSVLPKLPSLLSKGAGIKLSDVTINTPDGLIQGSIELNLPSAAIENPFQLLQKIQGNCKLSISANMLKSIVHASLKQKNNVALQLQQASMPTTTQPSASDVKQQIAAQTDEKIAQLVQSGVIIMQGDHYTLDANLADGHLTINSKAFTPSMLQF